MSRAIFHNNLSGKEMKANSYHFCLDKYYLEDVFINTGNTEHVFADILHTVIKTKTIHNQVCLLCWFLWAIAWFWSNSSCALKLLPLFLPCFRMPYLLSWNSDTNNRGIAPYQDYPLFFRRIFGACNIFHKYQDLYCFVKCRTFKTLPEPYQNGLSLNTCPSHPPQFTTIQLQMEGNKNKWYLRTL